MLIRPCKAWHTAWHTAWNTYRKKVSLIFLKLDTLKVYDKWMCGIFEFWWNNFLMGMKFNFKFESWEKFTKDFHVKKKVLWFCWNLAHIKFTIFKCAQFSSFGETTFLWEWNSISSLRFGKIFTKDFHVKKKLHGNSL